MGISRLGIPGRAPFCRARPEFQGAGAPAPAHGAQGAIRGEPSNPLAVLDPSRTALRKSNPIRIRNTPFSSAASVKLEYERDTAAQPGANGTAAFSTPSVGCLAANPCWSRAPVGPGTVAMLGVGATS